jgi:predicted nucleotidyltransferase
VDLPPDFKELLAEFARSGVEAVLVGGYAVAYHGRPRATKDIDVVLEGSAANLARAADALARFGAAAVVIDGVRKLAPTEVVYMGQPPLRVDFLRAIDGVDPVELFSRAVIGAIDGVPLRVIDLGDLIVNKRAVGRPQDLIDVEFLERVQARKAQETQEAKG